MFVSVVGDSSYNEESEHKPCISGSQLYLDN